VADMNISSGCQLSRCWMVAARWLHLFFVVTEYDDVNWKIFAFLKFLRNLAPLIAQKRCKTTCFVTDSSPGSFNKDRFLVSHEMCCKMASDRSNFLFA
jgi:hypothetical protein